VALTTDTIATVPALVFQRAASYAQEVILRKKQRGIWQAVTWAELAMRMRQVGMALAASDFSAGDVVGVLSNTRPEAAYADLGALSVGCASACLVPQNEADHAARMLRDTGCRLLFVENEEQLDKALLVRDHCPLLQRIVIFDMQGLRELDDPMCESLDDFLARGIEHDRAHPAAWEAALHTVTPDRPAALLLPMGADGVVETLSHRDIMTVVEDAATRLDQRHGDERVAFLPMSGMMERVLGLYVALSSRTVSNYLESPDTLIENLREVQPTVLGASPLVWERFRTRIVAEVDGATWLQKGLFNWAIGAGEATNGAGTMAWVARKLVLGSVRREMGLSRLRLACIGAASLSPDIARWYLALGIEMTRLNGDCARGAANGDKLRALIEEFTCAA
jgi:long-chain acyl-CoA synthetase